jgi:hypothetical protein
MTSKQAVEKTPICGVPLILRRCSVHSSRPHSSGFRAPCIWAFLISLKKKSFSTGSEDVTPNAQQRRMKLG